MLEHVTHEITIEALPTEIPESIAADVSGMVIGDTLQLSALIPPEGVEFALGEDQDADEITIATLSPPRVEEEPEPELEEEAELVGEEGESPRARRPPRRARPRGRGRRPTTRSSPVALPPPAADCRAAPPPPARSREAASDSGDRILIVGLGNPGARYAKTRHNLGFEAAAELSRRWELPKAKQRFRGLIAEGRTRPGGPRVAILLPQTYMNESGDSAAPARGQLKVPLDRVVAIHDEIDLPFGEVRAKLGGGVAGHNGLKSLARGLGSPDFWRVRAGVGRPDSTDPRSSPPVLGRFAEPDDQVKALIAEAADETERLIDRIAADDE